MLLSILIFLLAGIAEIGGGYLIWMWLRDGRLAILVFSAALPWLCTE
jgi:small multidrug resistance family-3 protein